MREQQQRDTAAWVCRRLEDSFGRPRQPGRARNPLETLIHTILSQNTSDTNSARACRALRRRFPSWDQVLAAPIGTLAATIRCGGLAKQKSRTIHAVLTWVRREFGRLDLRMLHKKTDEEIRRLLEPLPGIGPKTVHVLLAFALHRDAFAVDTHVHRVVRRLGLIPTLASAARAHDLMAPLVPPGKAYSMHVNLIRLGRERCHPRVPECGGCPLRSKCPSRRRLSTASSSLGH